MTNIDPSARVASGAQIGADVVIGPNCIIGPDVKIGEGCKLVANVHVMGHTQIGAGTTIFPFASLGSPPQSTGYRGGPTQLIIGANCLIRENVTMNTGTEDAGGVTRVGDKCMFMAGSHVGHDCIVDANVTLANGALLGGHVEVGSFTFIGGGSAVHQFTRIGEGSMIAGLSGVAADCVPFALVIGHRAAIGGMNVIGLRRRGFTKQDIHRVRTAYQELFEGEGGFGARAADFVPKYKDDPVVGKIAAFVAAKTKRPLMRYIRGTGRAASPDSLE